MKKIVIVICCFFTTVLLNAQVPGYQGKRGAFEVQVAPSLMGVLDAFSDAESVKFPITYKLHGEYAIKRKKSLGLEFRQLSVGSKDGTGSYTNRTLMLQYIKYNRDWALAPNGHYFSYGLGYNMRSIKGLTSSVTDTSQLNRNFFSLEFSWGQRYIIGKRLCFNYGFETGLPLNAGSESTFDWGFMLFNMNLGLGFIF